MTSCPRCQRTYDDGVRFCPVDGEEVVASDDPSVSRNVGRVLGGQFELRELAGRGATGMVWRAYQKSMDRIVAVKILHHDLAREPDVVRRFLREARAIAKVTHPNIVTVHLVGETEEGVPYLVMEHVDGITLETVIEAQGALPLQRVIHLGRQIAQGLGEAHANGIIHRDLKPANILVTDRGRIADTVKILDFGIAKLTEPGKEISQLTRGAQVIGTPHYMAPEQGAGDPVDARTDLYALGVVLFRLSTGQVPFDAPAGMQVVLRHLRDKPPSPRSINPLVPEALERLILKCLEKRPADRPADAEDVVAALDAIGTRPVAPPPDPMLLSGVYARPPEPLQHGNRWLAVGLVLFVGASIWAAIRYGDRPVVYPTVDLATSPDLVTFDLSMPPDLATPPDLAAPDLAKHRRVEHDDDLPVTVFGPDDKK